MVSSFPKNRDVTRGFALRRIAESKHTVTHAGHYMSVEARWTTRATAPRLPRCNSVHAKAPPRQLDRAGIDIHADRAAAEPSSGDQRGAAAAEAVEHGTTRR